MIQGTAVFKRCGQRASQFVNSGGQAAVEFALVLTVALIVLFVAIQMAVIGQASLALGQMTYQGARYASYYTGCTDANTTTCGGTTPMTIEGYMLSVASPTIQKLYQANNSALTVTYCVTPAGSSTQTCGSSTRSFGDTVTIKCSLNVSGLLFLPNPFLGIHFPTTLNSQESALSEGQP